MNLQAIIFDFGNVISVATDYPNDNLDTIASALAKKYGTDPEEASRVIIAGWLKARVDPREDAGLWENTARTLGISVSILKEEFLTFPQPEREVLAFIRKLKPSYRVAMLSNQIQSWHTQLMEAWDITDLFDPIVTSYEEGIAKPDLRIYERLLAKLHLPGEVCLYIDDLERNLIPARELGMHTIHRQSTEQLLKELHEYRLVAE